MDFILLGIAAIAGIVNLVCAIYVLIKLFQAKGVLHGILGFFCGIYTFIWGWMNADSQGIRNWMIAWSVALVLTIIFNAGAGAMSG